MRQRNELSYDKDERTPFSTKRNVRDLISGDVQQCPSQALVSTTPSRHIWSSWDAGADGEGCKTDEKVCPSLAQVMATPIEDRWRVWDAGGDSDYCDVKDGGNWAPNRVKPIRLPGNVRQNTLPQYVRAIRPREFADHVAKVYARDLAAGRLGEHRLALPVRPWLPCGAPLALYALGSAPGPRALDARPIAEGTPVPLGLTVSCARRCTEQDV